MASIGAHELLNWLSNLFSKDRDKLSGDALYDSVMSAALNDQLYLSGLASDTFDGRFEAVTLLSAIVLRKLRAHGAPGKQLADKLYRRVFDGFDHALRERGAGDSSIARKVRGYGERYFGLARAVDAALDTTDSTEELLSVISRNGVGGGESQKLVQFLVDCDLSLSVHSLEEFQSGQLDWPRTGE